MYLKHSSGCDILLLREILSESDGMRKAGRENVEKDCSQSEAKDTCLEKMLAE